MTDLIDAKNLSSSWIEALFKKARQFETLSSPATGKILSGRNIVTLFFEHSTRTRMSFEFAAKNLGASISHFSASTSSVSKGETLLDTARTLAAMNVHALIIRHPSSGTPKLLADALEIPVINAGDGFHEHPTQALIDAYTIQKSLKTLKSKHVLIVGDIAHSRVARSNIHLLPKLGARVSVCGPPTLLPPALKESGIKVYFRLEDVLREVDVVMTLRVQKERQNTSQIPSEAEYAKFWGINKSRLSMMKPEAILLDPGPVNWGIQIDPEIARHPKSLILDQVNNGVTIRTAVLSELCAKGSP